MTIRAYKYRLYPSKRQTEILSYHLHISKELWNGMLARVKEQYGKEKKFPSKYELREMVKCKGLYSQAAQELVDRLLDAIRRKTKMKKQGKKCGFPRFKSFERMKSLAYPQSGFILNQRLEVTPFGSIPIKRHRATKGTIKTLMLKREPTGKWFAIFTAETPEIKPKENNGKAVGLDLGLMNFAALSDGTLIQNPYHFKKYGEKLSFHQRRLSRKKKRSKNRAKARLKVARCHEKIANARNDFLHKLSTKLVSSYSLIALEKLNAQNMAMQGHGKNINDAAWNTFTNMLCYKAEEAGCRIAFVNPKNTTKECSTCGNIVEKGLYERQHNCLNCGLSIDRDLNASINILKRATAGMVGSNAWGDGTTVSSLNQEAQGFSPK